MVFPLLAPRYVYVPEGFPGDSVVKNPPVNAEDTGDSGLIPGSGRYPGGGNGNPLQYFAWRIPCTEEPSRLQSMGLQRVGHSLVTKLPPPYH